MVRPIIASLLMVAVSGTYALCFAGEDSKKAPATQPVNTMCAVMKEDKVDPAVTVVHNGKTVGFCCKDCIDEFKKDPDKYMKELK